MNDSLQAIEGLKFRVVHHLSVIYPDEDVDALSGRLIAAMNYGDQFSTPEPFTNHWDQSDIVAISYGDSIINQGKPPLEVLKNFIDQHLRDSISALHILPFFQFSSDDGFSVIEYVGVNDSLGGWGHINAIAEDYKLMADLVINHCSARSRWFENFKQSKSPGKDYFLTCDPSQDFSGVVRPRTTPLLKEVQTSNGIKYVWCTFSHDQIDLDFRNPEVLCEFVKIIDLYLTMGIDIIRLDAVAFLWKTLGTPCINLDETHEIVRLIRTLIEFKKPDAVLITETNIPTRENLSYFGNGNEAHWIYNFGLPPLLVHGLLTGNAFYLKNWLMSTPPTQSGTAFFNIIASHDGIGLRPVEGILSEGEVDSLVNAIQKFGGRISWRSLDNGKKKPYEINISLYDALQGTLAGPDHWQNQRFICAHAIMLALGGVPAIYIHSLLGTQNDYNRVEHTNRSRSINRHQWQLDELEGKLEDTQSHHYVIFNQLKYLIEIRRKQPAFHPNAAQASLHIGSQIFAFSRKSLNCDQSILAINNVSHEVQSVALSNLLLVEADQWVDLISNTEYNDLHGVVNLEPYATIWLTNKIF
jgi:sucrose phosphorylase